MTKDEVIAEIEKSISHMNRFIRNNLSATDMEYDRGYLEALEYSLSYVKKIAD